MLSLKALPFSSIFGRYKNTSQKPMPKFLIIQTAFIGDVILATPLIEKLFDRFPNGQIDFMLRKGNEGLLKGNPKVNDLYIWDKKKGKYKELFRLLKQVRKMRYDYVINCQRFNSTGLFTVFSRGKQKFGFDKNPWSFLFNKKLPHKLKKGIHEVDRNLSLVKSIVSPKRVNPKLYPSLKDFESVEPYQKNSYVCLAPASVWFTKQLPIEQWVDLAVSLDSKYQVYFLGAPTDVSFCDEILERAEMLNGINLCGQLSFLQSAALMQKAKMNYVNDSAPMHLASAVNAPTTAFFCSTIPDFGFGPLADNAIIAQSSEEIYCRPCGLHGKKACPEKHFGCGYEIDTQQVIV